MPGSTRSDGGTRTRLCREFPVLNPQRGRRTPIVVFALTLNVAGWIRLVLDAAWMGALHYQRTRPCGLRSMVGVHARAGLLLLLVVGAIVQRCARRLSVRSDVANNEERPRGARLTGIPRIEKGKNHENENTCIVIRGDPLDVGRACAFEWANLHLSRLGLHVLRARNQYRGM